MLCALELFIRIRRNIKCDFIIIIINAKKFLDLIDLLNFSQHVTSITHKASHTLDLVITHDSEAVIDNVTVSDLLSDHVMVLVRVKHPKPLPTRITTITSKLRGLDAISLAAEVSTLTSKTVHTDASPEALLRSTISSLQPH